ncbi:hypothetical protein Mp_3g18850 [Marchantia polymorpha subsp. ruderalis]|uniref:Uncharacterized protein n=2 Tax=Marchantia polymorpha TaxID=3197 RepID=A0AAF6B2C1_MARPO|nr:hypothetical protein MARPO_0142s0010 [Marchantia polymorpha]BBN06155.1 hypothetical protein Mp_3g18850 [Marchantia polymorpha subsp. ruderalis]|eukprot:PTQ29379.1 hypothetical protein MARPO_0142s0010 [Marchantia polymorpha]
MRRSTLNTQQRRRQQQQQGTPVIAPSINPPGAAPEPTNSLAELDSRMASKPDHPHHHLPPPPHAHTRITTDDYTTIATAGAEAQARRATSDEPATPTFSLFLGTPSLPSPYRIVSTRRGRDEAPLKCDMSPSGRESDDARFSPECTPTLRQTDRHIDTHREREEERERERERRGQGKAEKRRRGEERRGQARPGPETRRGEGRGRGRAGEQGTREEGGLARGRGKREEEEAEEEGREERAGASPGALPHTAKRKPGVGVPSRGPEARTQRRRQRNYAWAENVKCPQGPRPGRPGHQRVTPSRHSGAMAQQAPSPSPLLVYYRAEQWPAPAAPSDRAIHGPAPASQDCSNRRPASPPDSPGLPSPASRFRPAWLPPRCPSVRHRPPQSRRQALPQAQRLSAGESSRQPVAGPRSPELEFPVPVSPGVGRRISGTLGFHTGTSVREPLAIGYERRFHRTMVAIRRLTRFAEYRVSRHGDEERAFTTS